VLGNEFLDQLRLWKTECVRIQKGKSSEIQEIGKTERGGVQFMVTEYVQNLVEEMQWADLVICHAGAGTTMEALDLDKHLVIVPNRDLMDDHQLELAEKLAGGNHAMLTSVDAFCNDLKLLQKGMFEPFPRRQQGVFASIVNKLVFGTGY
jgi:UDP-N-acetylglucosamine transferase subunit ALG13